MKSYLKLPAILLVLILGSNILPTFASNPLTDISVKMDGTVSQKYTPNAAVAADAASIVVDNSKEEIGFVNVNTRLNVRNKPWGKIIGKLYDGDKLKIIGREGDWLKIHYDGGVAYVHSHYVEVGKERVNKPQNTSGSTSGSTSVSNSGSNSSGSTADIPTGSMDPARYGYDSARFKSVFAIVEKFCSSNQAYVFGAGHAKANGYSEKTDCSGFVGQFIQKMAEAAGIPPVFPKNSWYPSSQIYKTQHTTKVTSSFPPPNPRDSIKPGDVFVMNPGSSGVGHVGLFMGYTPSGQPIIAHSTPTRVNSNTKISGKVGYSGVRIEVLPARYASRWAGVYRIKNMDAMLNKMSS